MTAFFSNVLKLVSGSIIAQILGILLIPVITRIYSPDDFGVYQLFLSISGILVAFSCLSYQLSIMLPKEDEDSANLVVLCFILVTIISIVSGSIFIIFSDWIAQILNTPEISYYLVFLPLIVFLNGIFLGMTYWVTRRKRFGINATAQIVNSFSSKVVQIAIGLYSASSTGLIAGSIVSGSASLAVLFKQFKDDLPLFKQVTLKDIRSLAIRYKRFPLFTSWSTGANTISTQIAPLLLAYYFSPEVVGYYAIASMVVFLPMGIIGSATSQVFFQKACDEKNRTGSVTNIVREIQPRLISIGMFPMFVLMIIGADLFSFVLGSQWSVSGQYAAILAPWLLFVFIASPLTTIFSVLEKQTLDLTFNILILISRVVALVIGGLYGDPYMALLLYSVTGVLFWGWMNLYIVKISGISYRTGLFDYVRFFFLALVIAIPLLIVKLLTLPIYILIITAGIVTIIYYTIVILQDSLLKNELLGVLRRSKLWK
ncbi:MAG: oligosaccharide flippase family protein [Methanoregula sp.]